ncbi:MAG: hypothetical protein JST30_02600 [Armatimonadetes bacterium]|nr:hypothetical protein [Armatimonadota bacterium]
MSYRINTNITAMTAFRSLGSTGNDLNKSISRLSTGLRINSGADDPAGLIAVEGYRKQISGMEAALRNNQDAMNYAKTADGALDEVSRLLRDARSLAVANGNSSLDANQKQANQTQLNNILASIDRISSNTAFGTRKLLNGAAGTTGTVANTTKVSSAYVAGTIGTTAMTSNGTLDINVTTAAQQATVAGTKTYTNGTTQALTAGGTFTINGTQFTVNSGDTVQQVMDKINGAVGTTGVRATFGSNVISLTSENYGDDQTINLTDSGTTLLSAAGSSSDAGVDAVATVTYNYMVGTTATTATASFTSGSGLQLKDTNGNVMNLTVSGGTATGSTTGVVQVNAGQSAFQLGANGGDTAYLNLSNFSSTALSLGSLDITGSSVQTALDSLDSAINTVSTSRGNIGSFMKNTLESNMRAMSVAKENLSATESDLADIDVAEEMTNYTKLQILQQSGLSMLAQANSAPQAVLSLLR